jgi:hypothetical protein
LKVNSSTKDFCKQFVCLESTRESRSYFKQQAPQVLGTLRQAAVIQSTESSNRIEGITVPLERIKKLVTEKTTPRDRSEQEIAGYRDVLTTIHTNYNHIPSITRRGSISWESCYYQLIGNLSSG